MVEKQAGYYSDNNITDADQLFIEIGNRHVACLVKNAVAGDIEGFEVFVTGKGDTDWNDVFHALRADSKLLNRSYREVHTFFNSSEALIIPGNRFSVTAAEDYLDLVYGESDNSDLKHETVPLGNMVNAYRIRRSIHELIGREQVLYHPHHVYTSVIKDVLAREQLAGHFVKVQFYEDHFITVVIKDRQLQLIQSFGFETDEDVIFHLVSITEQFGIDATQSELEISGKFENGSDLHERIQSCFGLISFDSIDPNGVFRASNGHPLHFFTPFYKLAV